MCEIILESHISPSPDFTSRGWGKRVRTLGGSYSECRGDRSTRFVRLPATRAGYALTGELLKAFQHKTRAVSVVVVRGYMPSGFVLRARDSASLRHKLAKALRRHWKRDRANVATPLVAKIRREKRAIGALCTFVARLERTDMERALWYGQCALEANKWTARVRRCERRLERACAAKE